jgi:hypothetical protein
MSLAHVSRGNGDQRQVHVFRAPAGMSNMSPPIPQIPTSVHPSSDSQRRGLNRAATIDFSEARGSDSGFYGTLGRQSSGLLDIPGSPGGGLSAGQNLRTAKSFADLRSYTPSPVPSSASFPAALTGNISRFADYGAASATSGAPSLTPTATTNGNRDESYLLHGLGNISIGNRMNGRDGRTMMGMERESPQAVGGPIGSNRTFSMAYEEQSRESAPAMPSRQPRGPVPEWGSGFTRGRQNGHPGGRSSGELDVQSGVEIVVE